MGTGLTRSRAPVLGSQRWVASLLMGAVLLWALGSALDTATAKGEAVVTELQPGWNLVGWTEAEADISAIFEAIPQLSLVYAWDAEEQNFRGAARDGSDRFVGSLEALTPGMGLWLWLQGEQGFTWQRTSIPESTVASLHPGWNLLAWAGSNGASTDEALADLEAVLTAAHIWNANTQQMESATGGASQRLATGSGLWLYATAGIEQWQQARVLSRAGLPSVEFHGSFEEADKVELWSRIEEVWSFFRQRYDVAVLDVTVRFGGIDSDIQCGGYGHKIVYVLVDPCLTALPHEYSHAVQEYFSTLRTDGSWGNVRFRIGPAWLSEAVANYDAALFADAIGETPLQDHTRESEIAGITNPKELEELEYDMFDGDAGANYRLASLAAHYLISESGEQSLYDFYRIRRTTGSWEDAFVQAFGFDTPAFYRDFESYREELRSQYPIVDGTVLGPDGEGVAGVRIQVRTEQGTEWLVDTDPAGKFAGVALGGTYWLTLLFVSAGADCHLGWYGGADGYTTNSSQRVLLDLPGDSAVGIVINLPKPLSEMCKTIRGVARDSSGAPLAGLWTAAFARHDREGYSAQHTNELGVFEILERAGSSYEIHLHSQVARECTVLGHGTPGQRAVVALGDEDLEDVVVEVVTEPPREGQWIVCTAAE